MLPQKILYFSGVHATGKTSIIKTMAQHYLINATLVDLDQYYHYPKSFVHHQMKRIEVGYSAWTNTMAPLAIVDRGPYDALIYTETLCEFGEIKDTDMQMIHDTFRMLPADYRDSGYIIFLNPSVDRIMANIQHRNRADEMHTLITSQKFVKALHDRFERFYDQTYKIRHVATFDNSKREYGADLIVQELQQRGWLQPYEIRPEKHQILDQHGLWAK